MHGEPTPRQLEVLRLIADGLNLAEIGQTLHISRHTVKEHLKAALQTLDARNRSHAVALAFRQGLINNAKG